MIRPDRPAEEAMDEIMREDPGLAFGYLIDVLSDGETWELKLAIDVIARAFSVKPEPDAVLAVFSANEGLSVETLREKLRTRMAEI